jgi:flagellar biosynthesis/type III secretory pathway M-ring protein FliF/YscJ
MSTGIIIAIIVVVVLVIALVAARPALKRRRDERELETRRDRAVEHHRGAAEGRRVHAELAEQKAQRERAEAELQETRADMHEKGLADDELRRGDGEAEREGESDRAARR